MLMFTWRPKNKMRLRATAAEVAFTLLAERYERGSVLMGSHLQRRDDDRGRPAGAPQRDPQAEHPELPRGTRQEESASGKPRRKRMNNQKHAAITPEGDGGSGAGVLAQKEFFAGRENRRPGRSSVPDEYKSDNDLTASCAGKAEKTGSGAARSA